MVTLWQCDFIDSGVAIFPDGRIRPCCKTAPEYSKPISDISNPLKFADLKKTDRPEACRECWEKEDLGIPSYRRISNPGPSTGITFLDFRHSNQCNLKCRYCNPHFSNQWAKELGHEIVLKKTNLDPFIDDLLTTSLKNIYWCGGEPLIMKDHYVILQKIIDRRLSESIDLTYNTNLTVIDYKDVDVTSLWKHFQKVHIGISLDVAGPQLNAIRSGSDWEVIKNNIDILLLVRDKFPKISLGISATVTMMNIWFIPDLLDFANIKKIPINFNFLTGPDYLSLSSIPVSLQNEAKNIIGSIKDKMSKSEFEWTMNMLSRDDNEYLFLHAVRHILLLDKIRGENLFDMLPYQNLALDLTAKNSEYE